MGRMLVLVLFPAVPEPATGQPLAIEELDLEALLREPVVTASGGQAQERVLAAANVVVVTRTQIRRTGWRSLADILASVPGLYVIDDHVLPSVGVRGVTGGLRSGTRLVKVMINGVPVNFRPDLTAFLGPEYLPMEAVERVEIVQGPLSALYGANAFIATVNVITHRPEEKGVTEIAARTTVISDRLGGGGSALIERKSGGVGVIAAVSADRYDRSGLAVPLTFAAQDPQLQRFAPLFFDVSRADVAAPQSLYLQVFAGDADKEGYAASVQGGIQRLDAMGEFQVSSAMTHRSRYAIENRWSHLRLDRRWSDALGGSLEVGYATGKPTRDFLLYHNQDDTVVFRPRFDYRSIQGGVQITWAALGEQLSLRLGADMERDDETVLYYRERFLIPFGEREPGDTIDLIGPDQDPRQVITGVGVGVQATSKPFPSALPGLQLTGNGRADLIRYGDVDFPTQWSWRVAAVYQWSPQLVTKVIAGHAFQTPSGVLMFAKPGYGRANNVVGNADVTALGFPPLRPQSVTGGEAVVSARLLEAIELDIGAYLHQVDDRIEFEQIATDFIAVNSESSRAVGALGTVRLQIDRFGGYATVALQREIVDGRLVAAAPPSYPNIFGTTGVTLDAPEVYMHAGAHLRWAGERGASQSNVLLNNEEPYTLPGYATLDTTVSTSDLRLWNQLESRVTLSIRNVGDERHAEPGFAGLDIPTLGRSVWVELRQEL